MLDLMKELLGINLADTSKDTILNLYLSKSKSSVITYKNKAYSDEEFESQFVNQTVELAIYYYKNRNDLGILNGSQGGVSKTLVDGIPNSIKSSLGYPFISTVGTVI